MKKFVLIIHYPGSWECNGVTQYYTLFGKTEECVYTDFISIIEKELEKRKKNKDILARELKKIEKIKGTKPEISVEYFQKKTELLDKYADNRLFLFHGKEFNYEDFLIYDNNQWVVDYDMVNVLSLEDWFTQSLLKDN